MAIFIWMLRSKQIEEPKGQANYDSPLTTLSITFLIMI